MDFSTVWSHFSFIVTFVSHYLPPSHPPSLLSTLAPPLTIQNILTAVQGVAWRKLGERLIPGDYNRQSHQWDYPKLDEIKSQHQSDDSRFRAVIECWLQGEGRDKQPSWRALIYAVDNATETSAATDPIRHFAEPPPGGSHVTPSHSCTVYKSCLTLDSVHNNSRCA